MKKAFSLMVLCILAHQAAFSQAGDAAASDIISKLSAYAKVHTVEKTYLHFDKSYYAAGDTIYFKAYVTAGPQHLPSTLSGVLYAELINTDNKIAQSTKLKIASGVAWGDFALPDSISAGNYRVRAYTNWMRNNGGINIFERSIQVGSIKSGRIPESGPRVQHAKNKADIQFFAEGGSMVAGVRSKVAYKAIGINGLGINVKGVVTDNDGTEINTFSSARLGMGYFYFTPAEGKSYKAKLSYADGSQSVTNLPVPVTSGLTLSVNNDSLPKASIRIEASKAYFQENRNKDHTLVLYSGGIARTVTCKLDSQVITMDILKRRLSTGVATVTLFSPSGQPLCERLIFVQNFGQLNLNVSSDKTVYPKRGHVQIDINAKDRADNPVAGHFSVSVIDEGKVPVDETSENTILTDLLLTSDLKGYVEQPNYYFANSSNETLQALDVLMLTQGYRQFTWKQVLNDDQPNTYQPEPGLEIAGKVRSAFGRPVAGGKVRLINKKDGTLASEITDKQGSFRFTNLSYPDTTVFILQAVNAAGKNNTFITYNKETLPPVVDIENSKQTIDTDAGMATYLENSKAMDDDQVKYGNIKGKLLNEVVIKGKRADLYNNPRPTQFVSPKFADQFVTEEQMVPGVRLAERLDGILHGVFIQRSGSGAVPLFRGQQMLVMVDGFETDGDLNKLLGSDVESVEVLKTIDAVGVYGRKAGNGVLVITTKQEKGMQTKDMVSFGILPITPKGFYKAREFYTPKYENTMRLDDRSDLRSTIFWQPELLTDEDGNASFAFDNADGKGTYRVTIEGIDDKGNLGRQVYKYTVR